MSADDDYRDRRVLVTGADGFMGSHLTERLLSVGARVTAVVRYTSQSTLGGPGLKRLAHVAERLERVLQVDLGTPDACDAIVAERPDVIMHLAADAWVPRSFELPREVVENNVGSTLQVLAAASRLAALSRVVVTSSSEIYGTAQTERIGEDHPLEPTSPYAASKVACDRLAASWHRTFGTPVAIIRPFNTYGPRHVYDVIPKFIRLALAGAPLTVHGTGEQSRDFTYVDDMVEAFLLVGARPEAVGRAINFGTGTTVAIAELARTIVRVAGSSSEIVHDEARRAEVARLCCDATVAQRAFGWQAHVPLEEGLRRNVQWERERLGP